MSRSNQFGSAGSGISRATNQFGENATVGAVGERYAALALERAGITTNYQVFYSLRVPRNGSKKDYGTDVDLAVANGKKVILVDIKKWSAKHTYWTLFGLPFKGLSPLYNHNGEWKLSQNMEMAVDRYRKALPGCRVEAMVAFVPTKDGGTAPNVTFFKWPGNIRSYRLGDAINQMFKILGRPKKVDPRVTNLLASLVK